MALNEGSLPFRKLDFVTDASGYIAMLIYNSHPPGELLIAPKYYPDPRGTWISHDSGQKYNRFEYYWNLKQKNDGESSRVYEVDKNPLHDYATDVVDRFNQHLAMDPCHGVPMYRLPRGEVARYWDARKKYMDVQARVPASMQKFTPFLKKMADAFEPSQVGITGSYLYDLHQDFSDINFVLYDNAVTTFRDFLSAEKALVPCQDIEITYPGSSWPGWLGNKNDVSRLLPPVVKQDAGKAIVQIKHRFIGSMHDPAHEGTRAGFWMSNSVDPHPHGTFKKVQVGIAVVTGHVASWVDDLPSGHLRLDNVELLGIHPVLDPARCGTIDARGSSIARGLSEKVHVSAVQVIGEFNRMLLADEDIIAYGLVEKITIAGQAKPVHELLVGGREVGGWIFPVQDTIA